MSTDDIDELARRLFEAAREERPAAELVALVRAGGEPARGNGSPESGARLLPPRRRASGPWLRWLAAAALLGSGVLLALLGGQAPEASLSISAETPPAARPSSAPPPSQATGAEPAPLLESFESSAAPRAVPRAPERRQRSPLAPTPPNVGASAPRVAAPVSLPLSAQLELLKRARSLLRSGDAASALETLDRYASERGTDLEDEAQLLRVEALSALGRRSEATELAGRFVAQHPDSPLSERAQRFLSDPGIPAAAGAPPTVKPRRAP
ncbi:MAG: hypothetical protein ABI895_33340 [Deltaproteobacteria bacterium]